MCFPHPGPRCSYHAHKEYLQAMKGYERANTPVEKIKRGDILEEKKEAFYSTPRGQNFLRREADATEGLEKEQFLLLLRQGKATRTEQLKAYNETLERKDTSLKENLVERGKKLSRYNTATGIASIFLSKEFPELNYKILADDTIEVAGFGKILILPAKYQHKWGTTKLVEEKFKNDNPILETLLNSTSNTKDISGDHEKTFFAWFKEELRKENYSAVAAVNTTTQDVVIFKIEDLSKTYTPRLKKKQRLGGTTYFYGEIPDLLEALKDTPFAAGKIVQVETLRKTIIFNVPPQPEKIKHLNSEIYLGYRDNVEDPYYEVRKKHVSANYNIMVLLKALRNLNGSTIENDLRKALKEAEIVHKTSKT